MDLSTPSSDAVVWKNARFDHRTPVPVTKEQLLAASRAYREYNQICKDSEANLKFWSLWSDVFWDDPEHRRVNNCIMAGTPISMADGTSIAIEKVRAGQTVFSFSRRDKGLVVRPVKALLHQGSKPCVEVMFLDGRKLTCTTDHRVLAADGEWVPAGTLKPMESAVSVGVTYAPADGNAGSPWTLNATQASLGFSLDLRDRRREALAFARLLGYHLTDGCAKERVCGTSTALFLGHEFDVRMAQDDIELLTGQRPSYSLGNNTYQLTVPCRLGEVFSAVGASTADRKTTVSSLPSFLLEEACPDVIIQQFLAGMFGGDGRTVSVGHQSIHKMFTGIGFSKSIIGAKAQEQLTLLQKEMGTLMERLGVSCAPEDWRVVQGVTSVSKKGATLVARRKQQQGMALGKTHLNASEIDPTASVSLQWNLKSAMTIPFADRVGFAYCCHKQMRLTSATAVMKSRAFLFRQRKELMQAVDRRNGSGQIFRDAFRECKRELAEREHLHPLVSSWEPRLRQHMTETCMHPDNAVAALLSAMDAHGFFSEPRRKRKYSAAGVRKPARLSDAAPNHSEYGVHREASAMPMFRMPVVSVRPVGVRRVYDLCVPTEGGDDQDEASFVANGITVHNCLAYALNSRDSIYHRTHKPQPGDINGCPGVCPPLTESDYVNRPEKIVSRLRRDFNTAPHELIFPEDEDFDSIQFPPEYTREHWDRRVPPPGFYAACLLIATQNGMYDYHFARQDSNGFWSHKPGSNMVENVDASGNLITNPERADWFYDPQNHGVGYNYTFYRWIFVMAKAPSRAATLEENYEHANKRFSLRPDLFYDPHHPGRSREAANVAREAATAVSDDRKRQKSKTAHAASAVAGSASRRP